MRGGDQVTVRRVFATPKAIVAMELLAPGTPITDVFPSPGETITLMADDSPYFVYEVGPYRVVLCVARRKSVTKGTFVVVNVQFRRRK